MRRRHFLQNTIAAAGAWAAPARPVSAASVSRVIDTHTHFYDPARADGVPWPDSDSPLYRTVLPKDWLAVASPHGVAETVVVEASEWPQDNEWILELARREKSIIGFIGHLLPGEVDFAKHLKRYAADPIFRGFRIAQDDFLEQIEMPGFSAGVKLMADLELTLELNGSADYHLTAVKVAAEMPALRIMIDHVGGAGDPMHPSPEWRAGMQALGRQKNVYCKVSALTEQSDVAKEGWGGAPRDTEYYVPILKHCLDCFGEDRLVYGSNWPVCEKGGTYADQFRVVSEYFRALGREPSEKYFWRNAVKAYGLRG